MKRFIFSLFILFMLSANLGKAQSAGDVLSIALSGDANTEQSAKLELIRILNERMNKLTVAQLNSRILVSSGVKNYYKVAEIFKMHDNMYALRGQLTTEAGNLAKANPGFGEAGNNFIWEYMKQFNGTMGTASALKEQLKVLIMDGKPIALPPMPTFNISLASNAADGASQTFMHAMDAIINKYGVHSQEEIDKLPSDKREAYNKEVEAAKNQFDQQLGSSSGGTQSTLSTLGNVVGALFGVPGAGSFIAGLFGGGGSSAAGSLVGSIVDKFAIPDEYYDSDALKLTDAERLKVIDELHTRMSECFQKGMALRANMNSEVKKRYENITQTRNETILYGPKK